MAKRTTRSHRKTGKSRRAHSKAGARRRGRKSNPLASLIMNPRKGRSKSGARKSGARRRSVSLASLLSRVGNPSKRSKARGSKGARRSHSRHGRKHNPLLVNPLIVNPKKHRSKARHSKGRKHNPSTSAARSRSSGSSNPIANILSKLQNMVRRLPLVGSLLGASVGAVGGTLGGAVGVLPTSIALKYTGQYFPSWLKPYGYSLSGAVLSGLIRVLPFRFPYKDQLAIGVAAAGGAVDVYRKMHGKSQDLSGYGSLLADVDETGDPDETAGDDEFGDLGDSGDALAAVEFADASLADAALCGDDFSGDELSALEMGRVAFRRRFFRKNQEGAGGQGQGGQGGQGDGDTSEHAGLHGRRFGWLVYWIGFDNAKKVAAMPEAERQAFLKNAKSEAKSRVATLLGQGLTPTMQQAETAGLLVAA